MTFVVIAIGYSNTQHKRLQPTLAINMCFLLVDFQISLHCPLGCSLIMTRPTSLLACFCLAESQGYWIATV